MGVTELALLMTRSYLCLVPLLILRERGREGEGLLPGPAHFARALVWNFNLLLHRLLLWLLLRGGGRGEGGGPFLRWGHSLALGEVGEGNLCWRGRRDRLKRHGGRGIQNELALL